MDNTSPVKVWRLQKYRYRLNGSMCSKCNIKYYPYKFVCTNCHSDKYIQAFNLSPLGKVISWTCIHTAPAGFGKYTPYILALIKLNEGPIIFSQVCDVTESEMKKNLPVKAVFRRLIFPEEADVIKYGIKFEPL